MVKNLAVEDSIAILRGLRERYEIFHGVHITESAIHAAVILILPLYHGSASA